MWQLVKQDEKKRIFSNSITGGAITQTQIYIDKDGNKWFQFDDLMTIPYTRSFAATKITSLYSLGLSRDDLNNHINGLKSILKSADKDKYEKAYALVLDFENKANNATDAVKQMTSLVCVYFTINDEPIDSFVNDVQIQKLSLIESDPIMHTFFLNTLITLTEIYTMRLNLLSQIALPQKTDPLEVSD